MKRLIALLLILSAPYVFTSNAHAMNDNEVLLNRGLERLSLTTETIQSLYHLGIHCPADLLLAEIQVQQLEQDHFSPKSIAEIRYVLSVLGIKLHDTYLDYVLAKSLPLSPDIYIAQTTRISERLERKLELADITVYGDLLDKKKHLDVRYGLPSRFEREWRHLLEKATRALKNSASIICANSLRAEN